MKVYVDENPNTNNIVMSMSIVLLSKKKQKKSTRGHDYYTEALQHYGSFSMI